MRIQSLQGEWQFQRPTDDTWQSGTVPGGVYSDLLSNDAIPDPYDEDNELDVQWVGESDWTYERTVVVDEELLAEDRVLLQCEGLDTVATVLVNGESVGASENMHRRHEFDVTDAVEAGANTVTVHFESPVEYSKRKAEAADYAIPALRYPVDQPGRSHIRKAQCHYGWDWGPCLPTVGI